MKNKMKEQLILKQNEMKVNELRIGNIVSHGDYSSETFEVISIEFISDTNTYVINTKGGKNGTWGNTIDLITKVPLTKDWILKFGFWYDESMGLYRWGSAGQVRIDTEDWAFQYSESWDFPEVKYVHQLQNLCFEVEKAEDLKLKSNKTKKHLISEVLKYKHDEIMWALENEIEPYEVKELVLNKLSKERLENMIENFLV